MNTSQKIQALGAILINPKNIFNKTKKIYLLSHMRSRSTVLSHILGSNEEICGYLELGISYSNKNAFMFQRIKLNREFKNFGGKFLFDKILHNQYKLTDGLVNNSTTKVIILLREPTSTLKSMLKMASATGNDSYKDWDYLLQYYCSRLAHLEEFAKKHPNSYYFIESDELLTRSDELLEDLTQWLGLESELDKNYSQFKKTGTAGYGDFSNNIATGVLKKTKNHDDVEIPDEILQKAKNCYERCKAALEQY